MEKHCSGSGFNYCKWAKTLVAIPALPIIAYAAASLHEDPLLQDISAIAAVIFAVAIAIWIDRIPALKKKVRSCGCAHKTNS